MHRTTSLAVVLCLISIWSGTSAADEFQYMRAHFIDVGQGDATLLEFPCGAIMIDAGGQNAGSVEQLRNYLRKFFARRADLNKKIAALFVTHTHIDHNRSLRPLVESQEIVVERYIANGELTGSGRAGAEWMAANAPGAGIQTLDIADTDVTAGGGNGLSNETIDPLDCRKTAPPIDPNITILSGRFDENPGWPQGAFENGNNHSLAIRVDFGKASFLFTGDMEEDALETFVQYYSGTPALDVDVYHVGHHGSNNGTTEELLQAVSPHIGVISMGNSGERAAWTAWKYGHPRAVVVDMLDKVLSSRRSELKVVKVATRSEEFHEKSQAKGLYATGWDGDIVIFVRSDGRYVVRRER